MPLLKTAPEIFAQAHNLVQRGDFGGALARYGEAANKFSKLGDAQSAALANAYAATMAIHHGVNNPATYRAATQALQAVGDAPLKIGLREVDASHFASEATLLAEELEWLAFEPLGADQFRQKAQALQTLSMKFRTQIGDQVLILPELFRHGTVRGTQKALPLAAYAEQALGEALVGTDPKAAAEHYQSARLWWVQAGNQGLAEAAAARVRGYGRSARCWFCGREVTGEGVHFLSIPSNLTELLTRGTGDGVLASANASQNTVYACRGCHGAIHSLADQIAVQRMQELEARVGAQLQALRQEIAAVRAVLSSIRR